MLHRRNGQTVSVRDFLLLILTLNIIRFQVRACKTADDDPAAVDHFIREFDAYTMAVVKEAEDHGSKRVRNIKDYIALRQDTSGVGATLSIIEFGLKLPSNVTQHEIVTSLTADAIKLISLINVCISINYLEGFIADEFHLGFELVSQGGVQRTGLPQHRDCGDA